MRDRAAGSFSARIDCAGPLRAQYARCAAKCWRCVRKHRELERSPALATRLSGAAARRPPHRRQHARRCRLRKTRHAAGVRQILDAVLELAPALADAKIVEEWSGLRPDTPDSSAHHRSHRYRRPMDGHRTLSQWDFARARHRQNHARLGPRWKMPCEYRSVLAAALRRSNSSRPQIASAILRTQMELRKAMSDQNGFLLCYGSRFDGPASDDACPGPVNCTLSASR